MAFSFTENVLDAPVDEIICWCSGVSKQTLLNAIKQGATTLPLIRTATGACTLGQCREKSPRGRCCSREIQILIDNQ